MLTEKETKELLENLMETHFMHMPMFVKPLVRDLISRGAAAVAKQAAQKVIYDDVWDAAEDGDVIELCGLVEEGESVRVIVEKLD
jgi:hypothetical protein